MFPGRQNCPQLRTTALNQQAKKGVILLGAVIHLDYLRDPELQLHKGDREDCLELKGFSETDLNTCIIVKVNGNRHKAELLRT